MIYYVALKCGLIVFQTEARRQTPAATVSEVRRKTSNVKNEKDQKYLGPLVK